jgi:uncharacterized membrane protein
MIARNFELDALKAIAIVGMVFTHFYDYTQYKEIPVLDGWWIAPFFCIAMGMIFHISNRDQAFPDLVKKNSIRGCCVFILGCVLNAMLWGINYTFDWDILQFIGVAYIILIYFIRAPALLISIVMTVLICIQGYLWEYYNSSIYWKNDILLIDDNPGLEVLFFFVAGYFPCLGFLWPDFWSLGKV